MAITTGKTTGSSASSGGGGFGGGNSGFGSGMREQGNYNRLAASLNGATPNQTRDQSSNYMGGLGLGTGKTIYGNTAFGPVGGMATGYATRDSRSLGRAGMDSLYGDYSRFNNLNGSPMFNGALGGNQFAGINANDAYRHAQAAYASMNRPQASPGANPAGGGPVTSTPLPPAMPPDVPPEIIPGYVPGSMRPWPGQSAIPPNPGVYTPPPGYVPGSMRPWPGQNAIPPNGPVYNPTGSGFPRSVGGAGSVGGGNGGGW